MRRLDHGISLGVAELIGQTRIMRSSRLDVRRIGMLHKAKHILHSWLEEWECRYGELDTG
jgi:hypothetical protein